MSESRPVGPPVFEVSQLAVALGGKTVLEVPSLQVMANEVLAVIGPNGSGKTTLLLSLASLLRPAAGSIRYRGQAVGGAGNLGLRRKFAVVFQEALLLNTSVRDNVTLGPRLRGVGRTEAADRARRWLERFGIASLASRQARTLSGGEAKRVSLARAFALQPEVLFLDEPFSALDAPTRQGVMEDFEEVMRETRVTTVMVTHDRNEAAALADRAAVLIEGRIRQIGSPEEVFACPADEAVAGFLGAGNILHGLVTAQSGGLASVQVGDRQLYAVSGLAAGTRVSVFLNHEDITLSRPSPPAASSARNRLTGRIVRLFPLGSQVSVTLDCGFPLSALITRRSREEMALGAGQELAALFKASSVHLIPRR
ncbi:MAG: ABC transporter ATP-binding protein [Chloroflexi bacterium]|nr:ABC transporter ATP-binding protein [Chloroflexota bacterium]